MKKAKLWLEILLSTLLLTGCVKTTNDPLEVPAKTPSVSRKVSWRRKKHSLL